VIKRSIPVKSLNSEILNSKRHVEEVTCIVGGGPAERTAIKQGNLAANSKELRVSDAG
jgi:uridylate kinase